MAIYRGRISLVSMLLIFLLCTLANASESRLSAEQYIDPKGFFKIVPPEGWEVQEYPQDLRGKVAFLKPGGNVDLRVLVNAVDFSTMKDLLEFFTDVEDRLGLNTHIQQIEFGGRPAVQRMFTIRGSKLMYYDFLIGNVAHNLGFSAPIREFDTLLPLITRSLVTYEPIFKHVSEENADEHLFAKKKRLAELMFETGNYPLALQYANEGLDIYPEHVALQHLRRQIQRKFQTN